MQRYFANCNNTLSENDQHHLFHVMRAKIGTKFELVLNGDAYICEVSSISPYSFNVLEKIIEKKELGKEITLFYALAKGDKIDFVIQKATELGVSKIVLIKTKRDVVKMSQEDFNRKSQRYMTIAKEASEQCHRTKIPSIEGIYDIKNIPSALLAERNYVAYESLAESNPSFDIDSFKSISILIGSEGGIDDEEIKALEKQGFISISLGHRILRTETAAVYALSVLSYLIEK